jgi:hypothetical protein
LAIPLFDTARIAPVTEQLILSFIGENVLDLPKSY